MRPVSRDRIEVSGILVEEVGSVAASLGVVLYELTPGANTLEDAFLELTNIEGEKS